MAAQSELSTSSEAAAARPICGLIMPISAMPPTYDAQHWADVRAIIEEAIEAAGMRPQIVSDSFESDVITQRIISNIFNNPVVICDVSGLNPNVMFELGLRLASKKATIIVTDSYNDIPFDTRIIEHIGYPRNLRLKETRAFIADLTERIRDAHQKVKAENYKPFLENFTGVEAQDAKVSDVSQMAYLTMQVDAIRRDLGQVSRKSRAAELIEQYSGADSFLNKNATKNVKYTVQLTGSDTGAISQKALELPGVHSIDYVENGEDLVISAKVSYNIPSKTIDSLDRIIISSTVPYPNNEGRL